MPLRSSSAIEATVTGRTQLAVERRELYLPLRSDGVIWQVRQHGHVIIPEPRLVIIRNPAEEAVDCTILAARAIINSVGVQNAVRISVHPPAQMLRIAVFNSLGSKTLRPEPQGEAPGAVTASCAEGLGGATGASMLLPPFGCDFEFHPEPAMERSPSQNSGIP